jgi:outer membrane protein assembly factor BamB
LNTGQEIWKREAHTGAPQIPRHPKSTYAAETATTDGERLYVLFGDVGLYCYDLEGQLLWSRDIAPRKTFMDYGAAASPVVHDGQVFVVYDNLEKSWIASFDAKTGKELWKQDRNETHSWATPLVWQNEQRTEIVVPGKKFNRSYSLTGDLLWEFDGQMSNLVIPSPMSAHGMCYIASGYVGDAHRPTFAIKPGASGNITPEGDYTDSEFIEWYQGTSSSYNPSQTVYGDYLYTLYDQGFLTCHDARTGEQVYGKKRFSPSGSFTASPFAYNGYLFCLSEDGLTYVIKAGEEFEIVARNELDELCIACPAVVGDKVLIRTASKLYCLSAGAKLDPAMAAQLKPRRSSTPINDIWAAASAGDNAAIKRFLDAGVAVNAKQGRRGGTPLRNAILQDHPSSARLLIERGADAKLQGPDGNTPLHLAAFFGDEGLVKLLLEKGADSKVKNSKGETALDIVSKEWNSQLQATYQGVGRSLNRKFDLQQLQKVRPQIASLLKKNASAATSDSGPNK